MSRKRKLQPRRYSQESTPVLEKLRFIGNELGYPLLSQALELKTRRNSNTSPPSEIKRFLCFGRIPACCLHSKGSSTSVKKAEDCAAHAMVDFFGVSISAEFRKEILACNTEEGLRALLPPIATIFEQFLFAISANFLSIAKCTQFEMSPAAMLRGKETRKRVLLNVKDPSIGYALQVTVRKELLEPGSAECDDVVCLDDNMPGEVSNAVISRSSSQDNSIIFLKEVTGEKQDSPKPSPLRCSSAQVEKMRKMDAAHKGMIEEFTAENGDRRRSRNFEPNYFGSINTSNAGPSDVFSCLPDVNQVLYTEARSSDDSEDDETGETVSRKCSRRNDDDDLILVNMTSTSGAITSPEKRVKESEDEIGDIVDEWDENDDNNGGNDVEIVEENTEEVEEETSSPDQKSPSDTLQSTDFYNGHKTHRDFVESLKLPSNYQAKTIGVVLNEKLAFSVEKFIDSVTARSLDSVKKMSKLAWDHYLCNSQTDEVYDLKMKARQIMFEEFSKLFNDKCISLQVTGSTVNGCGAFNSDMDMCLCYPTNGYRGSVVDDFHNERSFSTRVLRKIDRAVRQTKYGTPLKRLIKRCTVVPAKVPIVRLNLSGEFNDIEVDINVNNVAGIYNSHLTHYYSLTDARFPALALAVKHWAMNEGINNAQDGYLNSYTTILLVVHYLQCGVTPAVLPNLQYLFPDRFDQKLPLADLLLFGDISGRLPPSPPNTMSLGELLIGFFQYYNKFDFQKYGISIRSAQTIPRTCLPRDFSHCAIFVEEPFDAINTARTVRTAGHLSAIKAAFYKATTIISTNQKFTMDDLGIQVIELN